MCCLVNVSMWYGRVMGEGSFEVNRVEAECLPAFTSVDMNIEKGITTD